MFLPTYVHPRWLLSPSVDAYKYLCLGLPVHYLIDQPWGLLWCYFLCDKHSVKRDGRKGGGGGLLELLMLYIG